MTLISKRECECRMWMKVSVWWRLILRVLWHQGGLKSLHILWKNISRWVEMHSKQEPLWILLETGVLMQLWSQFNLEFTRDHTPSFALPSHFQWRFYSSSPFELIFLSHSSNITLNIPSSMLWWNSLLHFNYKIIIVEQEKQQQQQQNKNWGLYECQLTHGFTYPHITAVRLMCCLPLT